MPRKQRFKPSRKPKPMNEEIRTSPTPQARVASGDRADATMPARERADRGPEAAEAGHPSDVERDGRGDQR